MVLADTHTHLFLEEFNNDRADVINNAINRGVKYMFLPNIDSSTIKPLLSLSSQFPDNCFPMIGLHPSSVKDNWQDEIAIVEDYLKKHNPSNYDLRITNYEFNSKQSEIQNSKPNIQHFTAIGETGIDLYWDKTYFIQQQKAFIRQTELALQYNLPIIIHSRNSLNEILDILKEINNAALTGIFHCFPGNTEQAEQLIQLGFKIGIGGVLTYKNSALQEVVQNIDLNYIVLETDSPYLSPVPFRGKRNESANIYFIAERIAQIKNLAIDLVAEITTKSALRIMNSES